MIDDALNNRLDRIEQHVQNLDTRLTGVEQILPTLATKDDLKAFATKDDLKAFATKDDLKAFATKDDLKAFPTREEAKAFATKDDLRRALEDVPTRRDPKGFVTKDDLQAFGEREGALMRQFVLEVVEKSAADTRHEMRLLFEAQNRKIDAVLDLHQAGRARTEEVDEAARTRDAALDRRVTRLERS